MDKVNEYLRRADECRELSTKALTNDIRDHFERLADVWEKLADERKAFFIMPGPGQMSHSKSDEVAPEPKRKLRYYIL